MTFVRSMSMHQASGHNNPIAQGLAFDELKNLTHDPQAGLKGETLA